MVLDTSAASDQLLVDAVDKFEDNEPLSGTRRKREDDDDEDENDDKDAHKRRAAARPRRHNWQPKYEMEFGLHAIERDAVSGDVLLAMCGLCKAFGREDKYEQLVQQDQEAGNDSKKRRRRSLTTTKFFRTFRVDNIRSHLQCAHPRRWADYDLLPKQEGVRARYLQLQGELQSYDHLPMVDDVVLGGSALSSDSDLAYAQAQAIAQAAAISEAQHAAVQAAAHAAEAQATQHAHATSNGLNGGSQNGTAHMTASLTYNASGAASTAASGSSSSRGATFDYEKHLTDQIALDRERLEFEKMRFKKEVELRERELAIREKHMEQQVALQEKLCEANRENAQLESAKFYRLAEVLRDAIAGAQSSSEAASVV